MYRLCMSGNSITGDVRIQWSDFYMGTCTEAELE